MKHLQKLTFFSLILIAGIVMAFYACSSDDGGGGYYNIGDEDGDTGDEPTADGDEPAGDEDGDTGGEEPVDGCGCKPFEDACCEEDADCVAGACFDCVCVELPTEDAELYWENSEYDEEEGEMVGDYEQLFDGGDPRVPNLSCTGGQVDLDIDTTVLVRGTIKVFGVEAPCENISVDVFTYYENGQIRSNFDDSETIVPDGPDGQVTTPPDPVTATCSIEIPNVPAGKWLIFKSYDTVSGQFKDTYVYNMYITEEDAADGETELEINAITNTSWELIPLTMGVTNGVQSGRGAIAGSIKDCDGAIIKGATIGLSVQPTNYGYFNANVSDLLPMAGISSTNMDGTYASVNQPAETVRMIALAMVNGEVIKLHSYTINMLPGTVSIYAVHGEGPSNYGYFDESMVE